MIWSLHAIRDQLAGKALRLSMERELREMSEYWAPSGEPRGMRDHVIPTDVTEADAFMQHCVAKVVGQGGKTTQQAFAICTKTGQTAGYYKAGSRTLTSKGKKAVRKKQRQAEHKFKAATYEKVIDRKKPKRRRAHESEDGDMSTTQQLDELFGLGAKSRFKSKEEYQAWKRQEMDKAQMRQARASTPPDAADRANAAKCVDKGGRWTDGGCKWATAGGCARGEKMVFGRCARVRQQVERQSEVSEEDWTGRSYELGAGTRYGLGTLLWVRHSSDPAMQEVELQRLSTVAAADEKALPPNATKTEKKLWADVRRSPTFSTTVVLGAVPSQRKGPRSAPGIRMFEAVRRLRARGLVWTDAGGHSTHTKLPVVVTVYWIPPERRAKHAKGMAEAVEKPLTKRLRDALLDVMNKIDRGWETHWGADYESALTEGYRRGWFGWDSNAKEPTITPAGEAWRQEIQKDVEAEKSKRRGAGRERSRARTDAMTSLGLKRTRSGSWEDVTPGQPVYEHEMLEGSPERHRLARLAEANRNLIEQCGLFESRVPHDLDVGDSISIGPTYPAARLPTELARMLRDYADPDFMPSAAEVDDLYLALRRRGFITGSHRTQPARYEAILDVLGDFGYIAPF